jgi:hypothetical protein
MARSLLLTALKDAALILNEATSPPGSETRHRQMQPSQTQQQLPLLQQLASPAHPNSPFNAYRMQLPGSCWCTARACQQPAIRMAKE